MRLIWGLLNRLTTAALVSAVIFSLVFSLRPLPHPEHKSHRDPILHSQASSPALHYLPLEGRHPWQDVAVWLSGGLPAGAEGRHGHLFMSPSGSPAWERLKAEKPEAVAALRAHRARFAKAFRVTGHAGAAEIRRAIPTRMASVFYPFGGPDIGVPTNLCSARRRSPLLNLFRPVR